MNRRIFNLISDTTRPLYLAIGFVLKPIFWLLIGWWAPISQRRGNAEFERDVEANVYFLISDGQVVREKWPQPIGFDYQLVNVNYHDLRIQFVRGRGELNASVAPRGNPADLFELGLVITVLDGKGPNDRPRMDYLSDVGEVLRSRIRELEEAFSAECYPEFRTKLSLQKGNVAILTKQLAWELNKRLYR